MIQIARTKVQDFINHTKGLIFTAVFVKKDGSIRKMNCRKGVKAFTHGGVNKVVQLSNDYITVFDMKIHKYRTLNLKTIIGIKFKGEEYIVI